MRIAEARPSPEPDPSFDLSPIHLRVHPLGHPGAKHFLKVFGPHCHETLVSHCHFILKVLYPNSTHPSIPSIYSITLFVRAMEGVAYTTESIVDPNAREIHFSANYIEKSSVEEISGVLIHELVHVWQRNGNGTAPGGFIEGLADYIRLKSGLGARHWTKKKPEKTDGWDAGYERTAYFLEWVEEKHHQGKEKGWLQRVNVRLAKEGWGNWVWEEAGAKDVDELWKGYIKSFESSQPSSPEKAPSLALPTHA
ncbi:uncharacterized protein EI90DRAFT_3043118 [Cantharellus anzutake]|uniref:uncharacterized protein n=1 Tax=Cantharellus anzutake TaxID=1750568 RepID=UPI00190466F5|nr:uncharacterized protein EI90DRAFT_3043118 [Cantharellus anzutake]KAF8337477.1 hypothetical protein EI90DRAFT_3043118 [Cantharellus anzutake]